MASLKQLFTGFKVPKPDQTALQAQQRQEATVRRKQRDEDRELRARDRLLEARRDGPQTLFSAAAAGSKGSLGG
jgi:hypothetical protein